jgi:hypothetical protein
MGRRSLKPDFRWTGTRGTQKKPVQGEHTLYVFLTTEPNAIVQPVHSKAMPVTLDGARSRVGFGLVGYLDNGGIDVRR